MSLYRVCEDNECDSAEFWRGMAYDADDALERAYSDEDLPTYPIYIQRWDKKRVAWVSMGSVNT